MLALTHHTGVTLAEVDFLLFVIAGVWLVAAQLHRLRTLVAGVAVAAGGVLLIVATHWGHLADRRGDVRGDRGR